MPGAYADGGGLQDTSMKFQVRETGPGCLLVSCEGGLSWEDRDVLVATVDSHLLGLNKLQGVVLDLAKIEYVNSAGLGALFQLVQRIRAAGGRIVFAGTPSTIQRLLRTVGMERLASFAENVPAGFAVLCNGGNKSEAAADEAMSDIQPPEVNL